MFKDNISENLARETWQGFFCIFETFAVKSSKRCRKFVTFIIEKCFAEFYYIVMMIKNNKKL